jgi:hypothetical protein
MLNQIKLKSRCVIEDVALLNVPAGSFTVLPISCSYAGEKFRMDTRMYFAPTVNRAVKMQTHTVTEKGVQDNVHVLISVHE